MFTNPAFILLTLVQLVHALASSTAQYNPAIYMPVPADNVTVMGLESDAQLIFANEHFDPAYIRPVDPRGVVVPTTTATVAPVVRDFSSPAPLIDVFHQPQY